jgi:hypothetical protein
MTLPTVKLPDWTSEHAIQLRAMLQSEVFQRALEHVMHDCPELLDGSDVNKALVTSGVVKGYTAAISNLFRLTVEQPKVETTEENYPSLDDDWRGTIFPKSSRHNPKKYGRTSIRTPQAGMTRRISKI